MNFYEFCQNNTGGSFVVNDKLCHRLIIEAKDGRAANRIAEDLGCYWDGVDSGMDCPCCGDRWYPGDLVDLAMINTKWKGYEVSEWLSANTKKGKTTDQTITDETIKLIKNQYKGMTWIEEPKLKLYSWGATSVVGRLRLDSIEQYAQIMADLYGWTSPDVRIFYADGTVKEINSNRVKLSNQ
jgi:hypothetical protein